MSAIHLEGVSKNFAGRAVLDNISFTVNEGEVFGLLGPNGAGKTTTMRIVLGLIQPTAGTARVHGADLSIDDEARRSVGVLMENDGLYDRISAYQNLDYYARLYGVQDREARIDGLLAQFGLAERRNDMVYTFSKGMRRKLGIARAIIHDPEILLLDEPTSGLDPEARKMVRDVLLGLAGRKRMTVLLSSHNLDEVQRTCRRVAVISSGSLMAYDSVDRLRSAQGSRMDLVVSTEEQAYRAEGLVRAHPSVTAASRRGTVLTVDLRGDSASSLITQLVFAGIPLEEAVKTSRSLEDAYMELVQGDEA